jgi:hypothetical protein
MVAVLYAIRTWTHVMPADPVRTRSTTLVARQYSCRPTAVVSPGAQPGLSEQALEPNQASQRGGTRPELVPWFGVRARGLTQPAARQRPPAATISLVL